MKRFVTLMIVFAMLFAAVPAFADVTTSKAGEFPITSEKVTFDVWIEGGSDTDWSNNGWLKETEEITNIAINVIPSSSADALNKRNLLNQAMHNSLVNTWGGLNSGKDRTGACSTYWW